MLTIDEINGIFDDYLSTRSTYSSASIEKIVVSELNSFINFLNFVARDLDEDN